MTWTAGGGSPYSAGPVPIPPALRGKYGVRGVLFTVLVVVGIALGALVVGLTVVATGQPTAVFVGLLLAMVPVGPLVAAYLWLDRYEPEPVRLLVLAFLWGALVATAAALLLQAADQVLNGSDLRWSAVVVAPITEEACKGLFVLLLLWSRRHVIDGVLDGLVYAGLVGVGFAFTENILYFAGAYTGGPDFGPGGITSATALFVVRGVFSPFAHPLFTSATGIGVGLMVASRRRSVRVVAPVVGYVVAVCLHAAWNASAYLYGGQYFVLTYVFAMVPGFLVMLGLAIWFRVREGAMLTRSLADLARRGYVDAADVAWLARPSARRSARRHAALVAGPVAERVMSDYQRQAVELAALHNRVLRGTAPDDYAQRGRLMTQRLAALRTYVVVPQRAAAYPRHRREVV